MQQVVRIRSVGGPRPCGRKPASVRQGNSRWYGEKAAFEWQDACIEASGSRYLCGRKPIFVPQETRTREAGSPYWCDRNSNPCAREPQYYFGTSSTRDSTRFYFDGLHMAGSPSIIWALRAPATSGSSCETVCSYFTKVLLQPRESSGIIRASGMPGARENGSAGGNAEVGEATTARATNAGSSARFHMGIRNTRAK